MNQRRLTMMQIIDARKTFTAGELAKRFNVSVRTIQRDLAYLQQIGFPLYTQTGPGGGYRALPNRLLPPLQLTLHEALGLFLLLHVLEKIPDFPFGSIRAHLAEQYYASLPPDIRDTLDRLSQHTSIRTPEPQLPSPLTTRLLEAAMDRSRITFRYQGPGGERDTHGWPLGIYFEHGLWYMPVAKPERIVLYRVDRISELLEVKSEQPADFILLTLQEWFTRIPERTGVHVHLAFTPDGIRWAESDPWLQSMTEGIWEGSVPESELEFTARQLLRFGPEVEVLEPVALRQLMAELYRRALTPYTD